MNTHIKTFVLLSIILSLAYVFWLWTFCRFYVSPGQMAVVTTKTGSDLTPGQILAKKGEKGVQEEVLAEGRHFLNPIITNYKIHSVISIPLGKIGIVTSKVGTNLPEGQFLANQDQKGIWRSALGPGKYRLNPHGYQLDIMDAISIPIGFVGVITGLSGEQAKPGEFAGPNQKGIRKDILQPGLYYINPKELKVDVLEIGLNQVSLLESTQGEQVLTKGRLASQNQALSGLEENVFSAQEARLEGFKQKAYASRENERTQRKPSALKQSQGQEWEYGLLKEEAQSSLDAPRSSQLLETRGGVSFPSRDGFDIGLDMTVEFELLPESIAIIYKNYGTLIEVVDKIIMPQIQSVSRLRGSAYRAVDFIVGEGREKFQEDLRSSLKSILGDKNIVVHNALIRHVSVPHQILDPIQGASIAIETDMTNKEKQNTAKKQAELNTELSLIDQRERQVLEETQKMKEEIAASQRKTVAEIHATTKLKFSEIMKETAVVRANTTEQLGKAKADVIRMVEGEKANGFLYKIEAVKDPLAFSLYHFANTLNPDIKVQIMHSGEGTLWTDLKGARLADLKTT
jgi:regulator of protease activity HflC (stomatin/prohibitin superfamily)